MLFRGAGLAGDTVIGDRPDGIFQIASVGKQIVACAVLMLAEEGRLDLDEPVSRWLPDDAAPQWGKVTPHHLLTHTAGVPHWDFKTRNWTRTR